MRLTRALVDQPIKFRAFDERTYDGYIDRVRFADRFNSAVVVVSYYIPGHGNATAAERMAITGCLSARNTVASCRKTEPPLPGSRC